MPLDVKDLPQAAYDRIFGGADPKTRLGFLSIRLLRLAIAVTRDMQEGNYAERAASLAYTTLLSFAPLLAIAFSVMKGFGAHDQLRPFLEDFLSPLGGGAKDLADRITGFVENISVGVLGTVGVALLIYSATSLMQKIENAFNDIWRVPLPRDFVTRMRDYLAILFIGPVLLFVSAAMTAAVRSAKLSEIVSTALHIDLFDGIAERVFSIAPYLLIMLAFSALYYVMPNTKVRPGPALAAGFLTGVIWKILGKLFGIFVAGSYSYAAIYSAFAAIILFMLWVYAGWLVVLSGASIAYYIQNPSNQPLSRRTRNLSLRVKEKLSLQITAEIGRAFYKDGHGLSLRDLVAQLQLPGLVVFDVLQLLVSAGFLTQPAGDAHYIPAVPFDETSAAALLEKIRAADEVALLRLPRVKGFPAVEAATAKAEAALEQTLGGTTLKQLALGDEQ